MILVNSVSELQQYNLGQREDLYFEPIVLATDIFFQGYLPKQVQNLYSFEAHLMSYQGDEFIADITADFDALFAVSIYGKNYFNLRLKHFSPQFDGHSLFLIKITVKNAGFTVFSKLTEPYQRLDTENRCYAVIDDFAMMIINKAGWIKVNNVQFANGQGLQESGYDLDYIDGNYYLYVPCNDVVQIGYCYKDEDVIVNVPLTTTVTVKDGCQAPHVRLESTYNCEDDITGYYYGDPKSLLGYNANMPTLRYRKTIYIPGEVEMVPTEIKKSVNFFGKPQRVEYVRKYALNGLHVFPKWKALEIEAMFSGRRIFINGLEYIFKGGTIFEKDSVMLSNSWKLKTQLEDFPKVNDFSCLDDCSDFCYYFVIPGGTKDQLYYGEEKQIIAHTYQELIDYFTSMLDVTSVADFKTNTLSCEPAAVLKIDTFGTVPSFIYYGLPLPEYKVFAKYDDCSNPVRICEGISGCSKPNNITFETVDYVSCAQTPSNVTYLIENITDEAWIRQELAEIGEGWTSESVFLYKKAASAKIGFTLVSPYTDADLLTDLIVCVLPPSCYPETAFYQDVENAVLYFDTNGWVTMTGYSTNQKIILPETIYNI